MTDLSKKNQSQHQRKVNLLICNDNAKHLNILKQKLMLKLVWF